MIHISRSGGTLGVFDEARVREGLKTGEFIETDLGWTEGMATWRPLSELDSFGAPAAGPVPPEPHTVTPGAELLSSTTPVTPEATGLPWENRDTVGFVNALLATIAMVLTRPTEAFTTMKRDAGLLDPLLYTVILGTIGGVVSFLFSFIGGRMGFGGSDGGLGMVFGAGVGSLMFLIFLPVLVVIGTFIVSGVIHLCLMIVGGAKQSFETTLRVVAYAGGSANVFQLVPVCGGMIAGVYSLVLYCIGVASAHQIDTGRAVMAVLLPLLLCCGGFFLVMMMAGGLAALSR
ncbi:MAG: YIP1 family protein [Chthoniobacterales bacterium]|nr:YIP1 family protein [Chthoniobacterales bacterium]